MRGFKKVLIVLLLCVSVTGMGCNKVSEREKTTKENDNLNEIVNLSNEEIEKYSNLILAYKKYTFNDYGNKFYNFLHTLETSNKELVSENTISVEEAQKKLKDVLGTEITTEELTNGLFEHMYSDGNLKFAPAVGGSVETVYIYKTVKEANNVMKFYVNSSSVHDNTGYLPKDNYIVTAKINNESEYGITLESIKNYNSEISKFDKVKASSELNEDSTIYSADNATDDDLSTAWIEGTSGYGIGEYLLYESNEEVSISGLVITNGYAKTQQILNDNAKVRMLELQFSDGSKFQCELNEYPSILGYSDYISFGKEIKTKSVKVSILEIYEGLAYKDTGISELHFVKSIEE